MVSLIWWKDLPVRYWRMSSRTASWNANHKNMLGHKHNKHMLGYPKNMLAYHKKCLGYPFWLRTLKQLTFYNIANRVSPHVALKRAKRNRSENELCEITKKRISFACFASKQAWIFVYAKRNDTKRKIPKNIKVFKIQAKKVR